MTKNVPFLERPRHSKPSYKTHTPMQPPLPAPLVSEGPLQLSAPSAPETPLEVPSTLPAFMELPAGIVAELVEGQPCDLALLFTILSYCRAHGSDGEEAFIEHVLVPTLKKTPYEFVFYGPNGNLKHLLNIAVEVPCFDGKKSTTMFSCHVDTVHACNQKIRQNIAIDGGLSHVFLGSEESGCLGADNGAGVWLLLEMIRFGVPGTYVFHRGEERGCIGSKWIAENKTEWLKQFKRSVAFDRKDVCEIITHQRSMRTASDKFAMELAMGLSLGCPDLTFKPSPNGMYTDTASYAHIIPECTNIGVGYEEAHGTNEYLTFEHVQRLLHGCVKLDWDALPVDRNPLERPVYRAPASNYNGFHGFQSSWGDEDLFDGMCGMYRGASDNHTRHASVSPPVPAPKPAAAKTPPATKTPPAAKTPPTPAPKTKRTFFATVDTTASDEFQNCTLEDIVAYVESQDHYDVAFYIADLLEEIEGLKAQLKYRRTLSGAIL